MKSSGSPPRSLRISIAIRFASGDMSRLLTCRESDQTSTGTLAGVACNAVDAEHINTTAVRVLINFI